MREYDNKIYRPTTYCLKLQKIVFFFFHFDKTVRCNNFVFQQTLKSNPILFLLVFLLYQKITILSLLHLYFITNWAVVIFSSFLSLGHTGVHLYTVLKLILLRYFKNLNSFIANNTE